MSTPWSVYSHWRLTVFPHCRSGSCLRGPGGGQLSTASLCWFCCLSPAIPYRLSTTSHPCLWGSFYSCAGEYSPKCLEGWSSQKLGVYGSYLEKLSHSKVPPRIQPPPSSGE